MTPYIILIIFVFLFRGLTLFLLPRYKCDSIFFLGVFFYLFIFCAIRSFSVGIDISGYIEAYNSTRAVLWNNWDYIYFENGYIALMKVCNMIDLTSRGFFYVVYLIILAPVYLFLKRFSQIPLISVILFLCYQFFQFDLTGLRQAIAIGLCILAFLSAVKPGKKNFFIFVFLVLVASQVHRSSLIFLFSYFIIRLPLNRNVLLGFITAAMGCLVLNAVGVGWVLSTFENSDYGWSESLKLGSSILLLIIFAICGIIANYNLKDEYDRKINRYCTNSLLTAICLMFLFNGSVLLRSCMYYYFVFIISVPYFLKTFRSSEKNIIALIIMIVMLINFFTNDLEQFNLLPYKIGVNQALIY